MRPPCKGCGRRREGCHTDCEDYFQYRERIKEYRKGEKRETLLNDYSTEKAAKKAKRRVKYIKK